MIHASFSMLFVRRLPAAVLGLCLWWTGAAHAQTPFPSDALKTALSLAAAYSALGIGGAEPSSYLLLDTPDVAVPGKVRARVKSEIPGTTYLILLRGSPFNPAVPSVASQASRPAKADAPPTPIPALVAAERVAPGSPAVLKADFDVAANQWMTLVAFAQGRWFVTSREIKVGRSR